MHLMAYAFLKVAIKVSNLVQFVAGNRTGCDCCAPEKMTVSKLLRTVAVFTCFLALALPAGACPFCNPETTRALSNSRFYPNLLAMLSAFFAVGILVAVLSVVATRRYRRSAGWQGLSPVPLLTTSTILGIGTGGFVDGIVLHQILQWHAMLSNKIPPTDLVNKTVNLFWDGIFHAFTLVVTLVGIVLLWRLLKRTDINRSGYLLGGGMLIGWGLFNVVEGLIDHHMLKLHNVREVAARPDYWNLGFLLFSVLLLLAGYLLCRQARDVTR